MDHEAHSKSLRLTLAGAYISSLSGERCSFQSANSFSQEPANQTRGRQEEEVDGEATQRGSHLVWGCWWHWYSCLPSLLDCVGYRPRINLNHHLLLCWWWIQGQRFYSRRRPMCCRMRCWMRRLISSLLRTPILIQFQKREGRLPEELDRA